ncbi:MAG: PA14 domain-containing protein [candidate division KSB1 bacterium]|nr:PA14 domain-containing protein [candidate division KSB1 bacterium]
MHFPQRSLPWSPLLALLVALLALLAQCRKRTPEWSPAHSPLLTRWAKHLSPDNPWPEYPRPHMVRKEWLNLNGLWEFAITPKEAALPDTFPRTILVPFPVESALSGVAQKVGPDQRLWYRRAFNVPSRWRKGRLLLHFGAVDWEAQVFVNGSLVGEHRGGYDAFSFDVTEALRPEAAQEIVVAVWDPTTAGGQPVGKQTLSPGGIFYTPTSGIWQTVWVEPVPEYHISQLAVYPDLEHTAVRIRAETEGSGPEFTIEAKVWARGKQVSRQVSQVGEELVLSITSPKLWSPADPFLYELSLTLRRSGKAVDKVTSYFGLRTVAVGPDSNGVMRLLVNGRPLFQIGPLDQGFWPDGIYTAPSDRALRFDVEMMKRMGFNMVRKHVKVEPERWYYWCDRLGLLVWQDMPSGANRTPEERAQFERELTAMIRGRFNHPSIIMWVPFNEGWGQYDTERIVTLVRELDPTRLVNNASGWTDVGVGDVHDVHSYPDPISPEPEVHRAAVLGEFGGLGFVVPGHTWAQTGWGYDLLPNPQALARRYEEVLTGVHRLAREAGLSAAVYTQLTDVETENNGLLTYDREIEKIPSPQVALANQGFLPPELLNRTGLFIDEMQAELAVAHPGAEIRYTLDGSAPGRRATRYTGPIRITENTTLKARAFWPGGIASGIATFNLEKVSPRPAEPIAALAPGLVVRYYEGEWDSIPDFSRLQPVRIKMCEHLDLTPAEREELFGLSFEGLIKVPRTGVYLFSTVSDDGSRLSIGDQLVVDNDGLHGTRERSGAIALEAGFHPLSVLFFQKRGGKYLQVRWSGPGMAPQEVPAEALFHRAS